MSRARPPTASVAAGSEGGKLTAPSASRNVQAITELLVARAPQSGQALEIASGTGQHVCAFAAALPDLHWQPSDIDAERRASIDAYRAESGLPNLAPAIDLDASATGWGADHAPLDLILLINLLHLISEAEAITLIEEAGRALVPGGMLILYGPFRRDGVLTSAGDETFDAELRAADPLIGYKDTADVARWRRTAGLQITPPVEMPANNLALIATKASL